MTKDELIKDLATKVNKLINIPLLNEETEQALFEMLISIILGLVLDRFLIKPLI
ncbi:MAG: hypothetical protein LHW60_05325 [Candidatus Cloacimonetes bacterium]|jgi:regulator of PEP synthase PpsR (kinase-PPPase family)|nr:hypothetical protein [Candidatus Cloacimonadota bacterium]NLO44794.1 hypothetical protein [Candidatus Cloacimonadota bacterium]